MAALVAATCLAYQPAWTGGILWDDDGHLTRPELAPAGSLLRIWFEPGATQQYYPVVHTAFWIFNRLWGHDTLGYHLVNIALHAASACLLWRILVRLAVPGALLAAVIFALHPVHVESVAWITELKNVLSGVFYFAAALVYLGFDRTRRPPAYAGALALFLLAGLSKTVTVTLPVALLVVIWWQRGRITRRDVLPLVPFFALGLAAGLMTIWVERTFIGAQGAEFGLSLVERVLLAARAAWFYLATLLWPANLVFIYPRWTIDAGSAGQWLFVGAALAAVAAAWLARGRSRAPLAAILFFLATLFPALGFFDVYPFRFSYVADHFQYLASVGVIVPAAAGVARVAPERIAAATFAVVLGLLTWRQAHVYADAATLYRATLERNPAAWIAHNNLAALLLEGEPSPDRVDEALRHLDAAIALKDDYAEARYNRGTALERAGRPADAAAEYHRVLEIDPGQPRALARLAALRHDRASALLEQGLAHEEAGRLGEAEQAYRAATAADDGRAVAHRFLGRALHRQGRRDEAAAAYRRALALDPRSFEVHNDLGVLLAEAGRFAEAARHFHTALEIRPGDEDVRRNLQQALSLSSTSRIPE